MATFLVRSITFSRPIGLLALPHSQETRNKVIQLAALGRTHRQIAVEVGLARATVQKWLSEPDTKANVTSLRQVGMAATADAIAEHHKEQTAKLLEELKNYKDRQKRIGSALEGLGVECIGLVQDWLRRVRTATQMTQVVNEAQLSRTDQLLIRLLPAYMTSLSVLAKSSWEARDSAFSLEELQRRIEVQEKNSGAYGGFVVPPTKGLTDEQAGDIRSRILGIEGVQRGSSDIPALSIQVGSGQQQD